MLRMQSFVARRALQIFVFMAVAAPALVHAQQAAPPDPIIRRSPAPWLGFLVIAVLLALVIVVSLLPSKRGHQD